MRIEVRGDNVQLPHHTSELIERKARLALGRVGAEIADVRVIITDPYGPNRGIDRECTLKIRLQRNGEVHATASHQLLQDAVDAALDRAARSVLRVIARQREFQRDSVRLRSDARY